MSEFSSGKWTAGIASKGGREIFVVGILGTKKIMASCGYVGMDDEPESIANAQLIAAAPDLLAALRRVSAADQVLESLTWGESYDRDQAAMEELEASLDAARAVIAKATGEAS